MREHNSKTVSALLQTQNKNWLNLLAKVKELQELNAKVMLYLDPKLRNFCQVANRSGNRLTMITANGSIATELRFQTLDLLSKFQQDRELASLKEIQYKVFHMNTPRHPSPAPKKMQYLTVETAETILAISENLTDPKLKQIMQRIAGRVNKSTD